MSSISSLRTEQLARKHGKALNQKSNFKYLINSKINRLSRGTGRSKENEIESVLMNSAHKFAVKTGRVKTSYTQDYSVIGPIAPFELIDNHCRTQQTQKVLQKVTIKPLNDHRVNNGYTARMITKQTKSTACMTDECYHNKQMEIKIQLLQKERDDVWNSIAQTIRENLTLKQNIKQLTTQKPQSQDIGMQTDGLSALSIEIQTENQNINEVEQAKQFCLKIINQENSVTDRNELNLKHYISETLNKNLMKMTLQWQQEKQLIQTVHQEQLLKMKGILEESTKKVNLAQQDARQSWKTKNNIQKIYEKQIEEIRSLLRQKEALCGDKIQTLTKAMQQQCLQSESQSKTCLQYIETVNRSWIEKQRVYSALLSEAHKTIRNLMVQLKQFEALANNNYSRLLQAQRSQQILKAMSQNSLCE